MTTLTITVGIPGCGKSTLAEKLKAEGTIDVILSSDDIRQELTGDIENQDANAQVFKTLYRRVEGGLAQDLNVLVDATNLKPSYRRHLNEIAAGIRWTPAIERQALLFLDSFDFDLCQARNLARERVVPEFVMRRFHEQFVQGCTPEQLKAEFWTVVEI